MRHVPSVGGSAGHGRGLSFVTVAVEREPLARLGLRGDLRGDPRPERVLGKPVLPLQLGPDVLARELEEREPARREDAHELRDVGLRGSGGRRAAGRCSQ